MRTPLIFFVAGNAKPAGSKRGFYIPKLKRVVITDACAGSADWKTDVKHEAQRQYSGELWDCPIKVAFKFIIARPKSHYRSNGELKPNAPKYKTSKPDALKLARGVEDAITGVVWKDDSLIVQEAISKVYGNTPGCEITIQEVEE